jgi:hypothetical protein
MLRATVLLMFRRQSLTAISSIIKTVPRRVATSKIATRTPYSSVANYLDARIGPRPGDLFHDLSAAVALDLLSP